MRAGGVARELGGWRYVRVLGGVSMHVSTHVVVVGVSAEFLVVSMPLARGCVGRLGARPACAARGRARRATTAGMVRCGDAGLLLLGRPSGLASAVACGGGLGRPGGLAARGLRLAGSHS